MLRTIAGRRRDKRVGASDDTQASPSALPEPEIPAPIDPFSVGFSAETLPWLDRVSLTVDEYVSSVNGESEAGLRERLLHWLQFGYVVLPGAIEHSLIDAYLADVEEAFDKRELSVRLLIEGHGLRMLRECTPEQLAVKHLRLMDFHNPSAAGKQLALHPQIVAFLRHVFKAPPLAMQSLTFVHGSEQATHQDFPYVVPTRYPSHLAASWIALEDVHPDAGPLGYYPGSHTLPKFEWGNGLFYNDHSTRTPLEFAAFLDEQARQAGLAPQTFCPRKGDVFFWHSCLAHSGTPTRNPERTRRSFVTHYSTLDGNPHDRRFLDLEPEVLQCNGGNVFRDLRQPAEEDSLPLRV
jgi:ectoine hydroxylase-related dioxygenase (phytanoyl-CoA dioxygenase family)